LNCYVNCIYGIQLKYLFHFFRDLIVDYANFCNIYAEEKLILKAREKNYHFEINFDILNERICNFKKDLLNIILRKTDSFYFNLANQVYNELGQKASMPMVLMNRADILRVSYNLIIEINF